MGGGNTTISNTEPRIEALQIQTSSYGVVTPIVIGKTRISGNVIDYIDFTAIAHTTEESSGGKGGGGVTQENTTYTYTVVVVIAIAEGPISDIPRVYIDKGETSLGALGLGLYFNTQYGYMATYHPERALWYRNIAYIAGKLDLGSSSSLPNLNYEVAGMSIYPGKNDANPKDIVDILLKNTYFGANIDSDRIGNLTLYSNYCIANGLFLSLALTDQKKTSEIITDICKATNSETVWSEGKLKFIPYGDEKISGNGVTYIPINWNEETQAVAAIYDLNPNDFIVNSKDDPPIKCIRDKDSEIKNIQQVEIFNRADQYNIDICEYKDLANIQLNGVRQAETISAHYICEKSIGNIVARLICNRQLYNRNKYQFKLGFKYYLLEPMDIVTITEPFLGLDKARVRVLETRERDDKTIEFTVEECPPGVNGVTIYPSQNASRTSINYNADPGNVNAPVIFEPLPELTETGLEVWIGISGIDPTNWGGCDIWISQDGDTYQKIGRVIGHSRQGALLTTLPVGGSRDLTNALSVDLVNGGKLYSASEVDFLGLNTLCLVGNELVAYKNATLIDTGQYNLTDLLRGVYNTTINTHDVGTSFLRLDQSLFKYTITINDIGKTVYLKFQSFNTFGLGAQSIDALEPYVHTISTTILQEVTNLSLTEDSYVTEDGRIQTLVTVRFNPPSNNPYYLQSLIQILPAGETKYQDVGVSAEGVYGISSLKIGVYYDVRVKTVYKNGLISNGMVSNIVIAGKNEPPANVPKLSIIQSGALLKFTIMGIDAPDIKLYETRFGPTWETGVVVESSLRTSFTVDAPQEGVLTYMVKAKDYGGKYSEKETKYIITVFNIPAKNVIFERAECNGQCDTYGMYRTPKGRLRIQHKQKIGDFTKFADIFGCANVISFIENPSITLPIIDLGDSLLQPDCFYITPKGVLHLKSVEKIGDYPHFADIFGVGSVTLVKPSYATETFLALTIDAEKAIISSEYRTRVDGDEWSQWTSTLEKQFFGRRVQIKLYPQSADGKTNIVIYSIKTVIDVPDIEEVIQDISIEAVPTEIRYHRKFYSTPKSIALFTQDMNGVQATWKMFNESITNESFVMAILDSNGNYIQGKIQKATITGY
jgi:hypothetical protein